MWEWKVLEKQKGTVLESGLSLDRERSWLYKVSTDNVQLAMWCRDGGGQKVRTSSARKSVVSGGKCARGLTR